MLFRSGAVDPCEGGEAWFSCPVKGGKVLRVCGAGGEAPWMRYVYGKPGVPELVFPEAREGSVARFRWEERVTVQAMGDALLFDNAGVTYEVTEMVGSGGRDAEMNNYAGVYVTQGAKTLARIPCTGAPTSDWARMRGVLGR